MSRRGIFLLLGRRWFSCDRDFLNVRRLRRGVSPRRRIKLQRGIRVDDAVVIDAVIDTDIVAQVCLTRLRGLEDCRQVSNVAFNMPGAQCRTRLGGRAVKDVRMAQVECCSPVILPSRGHREIGGEDDL